MNTMFNDLVIFSMMAAIGIVGNVVTCFVIVRNKEMHTSINCYLFSLAITDLVILFVLFPCSLIFLQSSSTDLGCQLGCILIYGPIFVMALTVIALSILRYFAIGHAFLAIKHNMLNPNRAIKIILTIWLVGFACALPGCLQFTPTKPKDGSSGFVCSVVDEVRICIIDVVLVVVCILPTLITCVMNMLICTALKKSTSSVSITSEPINRRSERTPKVLLIFAVSFFLCWSPLYVRRMLLIYERLIPLNVTMKKVKYYLYFVGKFTGYSSSLINPIIHNIMSMKFQKAFKNTLIACFKTQATNNAAPRPCKDQYQTSHHKKTTIDFNRDQIINKL